MYFHTYFVAHYTAMSEDINKLIDINLRKITESESLSGYSTNFLDSHGGNLAETDSIIVARRMALENLIKLAINGYRCELDTFGQQVHNQGGWINYLSTRDKKEQLEIKIAELTAINLTLQNKRLRTNVLFSIIGFGSGFIAANWKEIASGLKIISPIEPK